MLIGPAPKIMKISAAKAPQYLFEWHPRIKRVYAVRHKEKPVTHIEVAFEIDNPDEAMKAVRMWLTGYREKSQADAIASRLIFA